jgi:hypothetical protein
LSDARDYVAEAKAAINGADQTPSMIAAVIIAQALERQNALTEANTNALDDNTRTVREAADNAWRMYTKQ